MNLLLSVLLFACSEPAPTSTPPPTPPPPAPPACEGLTELEVTGEAWTRGDEQGITLLIKRRQPEIACVQIAVLDPLTGAARYVHELASASPDTDPYAIQWRGLDAAGNLWIHRRGEGLEAIDLETGAPRLTAAELWERNPDLRLHFEGDASAVPMDAGRRLIFYRDDGLKQFLDPQTLTARSVLEAEPAIEERKGSPHQSPCDQSGTKARVGAHGEPAAMDGGALRSEVEPGATWQRVRLFVEPDATADAGAARRDIEGVYLQPEAFRAGAYDLEANDWGCGWLAAGDGAVVLHRESLRDDAPVKITRLSSGGEARWTWSPGGAPYFWAAAEAGPVLVFLTREGLFGIDDQTGAVRWTALSAG